MKRSKNKILQSVKLLLPLILKVISWILVVFKPQVAGLSSEARLFTIRLWKSLDRGPDFFFEKVKGTRQALLIYLAGEFPERKVDGVLTYYDGIPKVLGAQIATEIRKKSPAIVQLVLTILFATRALKTGRQPDINSIVEPSNMRYIISNGDFYPTKYTKSFWEELGYRRRGSAPRGIYFKRYHITSKSGPNGHALWMSWAEFKLHTLTGWEDLKILGGKKFSSFIDTLYLCQRFYDSKFPAKATALRKLVYFPDKEEKVRVVAIGDYWSQTVLRPFHSYLFRVLKKIPQDCTFAQGSFRDKIKTWKRFHSIDLTAATDRFPIWVISQVLKGYLPEEYVDAWRRVMVDLPFKYRSPNGECHMVSYAAGNPMGFYSSWNSFALAHHYVIYYCCRELGIPWKEAKYVLLGDDILIGDDALASKYKEVITNLGVAFSPTKTHSSSKLGEFAKRYIWLGEEVTPFPISALKESQKRFYLLVNLFREVRERGWESMCEIPVAVSKYYEIVRGFNSVLRAKFQERSILCDLTMSMARKVISANDAFISIIRQFDLPTQLIELLTPPQGDASGVVSSLAAECFADSNPENNKFKEASAYPLGKLAEDLLIAITGSEDFEILEHLLNSTHMFPLLNCYGQVEEMFVELKKEAYRIDTVGGGDWPMLLRTMALPLDDRVFVERQSHLIARASAVLGDKILERLKLIVTMYGL